MKFLILALAATALALPAPQSAVITINSALVPCFGIEAGIPSAAQLGGCQGANNANIPCQCPLVTSFGIKAGIPNTTQLGSCQGANNVNIPCQCPPPWDEFVERLKQFVSAGDAFGIPVTFPTDCSIQSQLARIDAFIDTLQNIDVTTLGEGCPIAAAPNFSAMQAELLQQL